MTIDLWDIERTGVGMVFSLNVIDHGLTGHFARRGESSADRDPSGGPLDRRQLRWSRKPLTKTAGDAREWG